MKELSLRSGDSPSAERSPVKPSGPSELHHRCSRYSRLFSDSCSTRSRNATLIIDQSSIESIMRTTFSCFLPALRKTSPPVSPGLSKDADTFTVLFQTCAAGPSQQPFEDDPTLNAATGSVDYREFLFAPGEPEPQPVSREYTRPSCIRGSGNV